MLLSPTATHVSVVTNDKEDSHINASLLSTDMTSSVVVGSTVPLTTSSDVTQGRLCCSVYKQYTVING